MTDKNLSPLYAVLDTIANAAGPISLHEISLKLGIEPAALEGMIDFWVRKGRLRTVGAADGTMCAITGCEFCSSGGPMACPLVVNPPTRYQIVNNDAKRHK